MQTAFRSGAALTFAVMLSRAVQAHPGHDREVVAAESGLHYLLQPEHALVVGISLALLAAAIRVVYLSAWEKRKLRLSAVSIRRDR